MNKLPLTDNERDVWFYIAGFISDYEYSPTLSEIAEFIGSPNHQAASDYVKRLEEKGMIIRTPNKWRNIKLIENHEPSKSTTRPKERISK